LHKTLLFGFVAAAFISSIAAQPVRPLSVFLSFFSAINPLPALSAHLVSSAVMPKSLSLPGH